MSDTTQVQEELVRLENLVHWPAAGTRRSEMTRWFASDFWEIGASGRKFTLAVVLDVLEQRARDGAANESRALVDVECRRVEGEVFLLTYLLRQPDRVTRRSSLWRKTSAGWLLCYHQGTIAPPS